MNQTLPIAVGGWTKSATKTRMKNASTRQMLLREFERKDLGKDLESSGSGVVIRPQRMTAIRLGADLIAQLREAGKQYGVPYQRMLKIIGPQTCR